LDIQVLYKNKHKKANGKDSGIVQILTTALQAYLIKVEPKQLKA